jgi:uncharacterized membrane protein
MSFRAIVQITLGIALWVGAVIALWFGMWIPLAVLLLLSVLVVLLFVGPSMWDRRSRARKKQ